MRSDERAEAAAFIDECLLHLNEIQLKKLISLPLENDSELVSWCLRPEVNKVGYRGMIGRDGMTGLYSFTEVLQELRYRALRKIRALAPGTVLAVREPHPDSTGSGWSISQGSSGLIL
tara:strand:- start:528 stop:881 length:354 start_codon:yes stop_codon:yes gene_type:complete